MPTAAHAFGRHRVKEAGCMPRPGLERPVQRVHTRAHGPAASRAMRLIGTGWLVVPRLLPVSLLVCDCRACSPPRPALAPHYAGRARYQLHLHVHNAGLGPHQCAVHRHPSLERSLRRLQPAASPAGGSSRMPAEEQSLFARYLQIALPSLLILPFWQRPDCAPHEAGDGAGGPVERPGLPSHSAGQRGRPWI